MSAKLLMIQGTTSNAGKSVITTALCRLFANMGWKTAPFKAWNMSLNSYVTEDGLEIGRSQGVQAEAAGVVATGDMNPFLLKPTRERTTQIIVQGKVLETPIEMDFVAYAMPIISQSLYRLIEDYDVIIMEGAGSPVELNIKHREVANMRVAKLVKAPVVIVADIDRGGALAGIIGTIDLFEPAERDLVIGSVLNKFRGDLDILKPGCAVIEEHTKRPVIGVIPYMHNHGVADEDSVSIASSGGHQKSDDMVGSLHSDPYCDLAQQVKANLDLDYLCSKMGLT